jgi:peptidoglycan biosynthesis protein MviN/MurJ (putative lipid II flippase)
VIVPAERRAALRLTLGLTALAGVNVALGFLYNWYLFTRVGPGRETDALFAGLMIPQLLLAILGGSLTNVLVPVFATEEEGFSVLSWTTLQLIFLVGSVVALILALTAPVWTPLTVPGFGPDSIRFTVTIVRIQMLAVVLTLLSTVQRAAYNARHRFVWAEASGVLAALGSLGFLAAGLPRMGIIAAAWAGVLRAAIQAVLLARGMGRYTRPSWDRAKLRGLWHRLHPLLLGSAYYKSDIVIDRMLATLVPSGFLSLYYLADQLWSSGYLVLSKAIAAPAIPRLAQSAKNNDWAEFRRINRRRLAALLLIAVVTYGMLLLVGRPVLSLLFEVRQLWWLLVALGGLWIGGAAGQIVATSFYAKGDTRTPMRIGSFWFTVGIGLKLAGFYLFGIWGVAIATSLSYLASATAQQLALERRYSPRGAPSPATSTAGRP